MTRNSIDRLFEESGISEADLVRKSGLERQRVEAILAGRWLPSPKERQALAMALDVPEAHVDWGHTMSPRNVRYHRFGLPHPIRGMPGSDGDGLHNESARGSPPRDDD